MKSTCEPSANEKPNGTAASAPKSTSETTTVVRENGS
jgi:hypothetical protein